MVTCDDVSFSELVRCYEEGGYKKAHGWTASTGQSAPWNYNPPSPWEYDPSFSDECGAMGSHSGCPNCIMTLVHLMKPMIPDATPIVCTGDNPTPHFANGCELLLAHDGDNDDRVTYEDAIYAQRLGATSEEVQFILSASAMGSINALCPGCYVPPCPFPTCSFTIN